MQPESQISPSRFSTPRHAAQDFARARSDAETTGLLQQRQAARRVAERSLDVGDCRELLSMLGLTNLKDSA